MPTLYVTNRITRLDEMCTVCWTGALEHVETVILRSDREDGVDVRERTVCRRCLKDGAA